MKHLTPYRQNETSLSPVRGRGMVCGSGLRDYRMNPIGQFLNVLFEHLTVNHAEKQTRLLVINGVVVNISSVNKTAYSLAIKDGLVVTGNNFCDRNVVTTLHHPSGNTRSIDGRMIRGYEEETNKESRLMGTTDVVNLIICRKNGLKDQAFLFAQTLFTQFLTILPCG